MDFYIENLKCGGCANSIKIGLREIQGVEQVEVIKEESKVNVIGNFDADAIWRKLDGLGYPASGNNTFFKKSKSMVSCVIGKLENYEN